jgi:curved DNA-binding protein CbpA
VGQAYRKLAFMYHPDRVAVMGPEARQYSEERMKEINAAYSELRRRGA